jgi:hypothetical protein
MFACCPNILYYVCTLYGLPNLAGYRNLETETLLNLF